MEIYITSGKGYGRTLLSAFDDALKDVGLNNFNLLYISSIIPKGSVVKLGKYQPKRSNYGDRLYVVKAEIRSRESGKFIGAALGWYQFVDGRGVFVEHTQIGETEEAVHLNLDLEVRKSLGDLCRNRNFPHCEEKMRTKMVLAKVEDSPTCVLVAAVYKVEKW